jgi:FkbM family methyltransferase
MALAFDCGTNNGDDTDYYLKKGYAVVAIEANPSLCSYAAQRFKSEILNGQLSIANVALADEVGTAEFFVHKLHSVLSTLETRSTTSGEWEAVRVATTPLSKLVSEFGQPELLKLDIEGLDLSVLREIRGSGFFPLNISIEAHKVEVLAELISMNYSRFKIIPCSWVGNVESWTNISINCLDGNHVDYTFMPHSSGPYGDDAPGEWMDPEKALDTWLSREKIFGPGWFDIQAST